MVAGNRSKLESGKPRKADARSSPPKGGVGYRDRALLRLIREEYNGQTSAGLEKDRSKDKETWGGKLEAKAEPAPTGLMAKAAAAVSSAVVRLLTSQVCSHLLFQRRLTCGLWSSGRTEAESRRFAKVAQEEEESRCGCRQSIDAQGSGASHGGASHGGEEAGAGAAAAGAAAAGAKGRVVATRLGAEVRPRRPTLRHGQVRYPGPVPAGDDGVGLQGGQDHDEGGL